MDIMDTGDFKKINNINFTLREIDVIAGLLVRKSAKRIANGLQISHKTVENHIRNIMGRLGCNSRESIVEFIEGSDQFTAIKKHSINLLIEDNFTRQLKKIALAVSMASLNSILFYDASTSKKAFIDHLIGDLHRARIKTNNYVWQPHLVLEPNIELQAITSVFYFLDEALIKTIEQNNYNFPQEVWCLAQKIQQKNRKIIFLLFDQPATFLANINQNDSFSIFTFTKEKTYYNVVFSILQHILPSNISTYIETFTQKYRLLKHEQEYYSGVLGNVGNIPVKATRKSKNKYITLGTVILGIIFSCLFWIRLVKRPDPPRI